MDPTTTSTEESHVIYSIHVGYQRSSNQQQHLFINNYNLVIYLNRKTKSVFILARLVTTCDSNADSKIYSDRQNE